MSDKHTETMLKEREGHCHLYALKHDFEQAKPKLIEKDETIAAQRKEIIFLVTRLAKYAPREFKGHPKCLYKNGIPDYAMWKLTREAETDEALIKSLREQLKEALLKEESMMEEIGKLKLSKQQDHQQLFELTEYVRIWTENGPQSVIPPLIRFSGPTPIPL